MRKPLVNPYRKYQILDITEAMPTLPVLSCFLNSRTKVPGPPTEWTFPPVGMKYRLDLFLFEGNKEAPDASSRP